MAKWLIFRIMNLSQPVLVITLLFIRSATGYSPEAVQEWYIPSSMTPRKKELFFPAAWEECQRPLTQIRFWPKKARIKLINYTGSSPLAPVRIAWTFVILTFTSRRCHVCFARNESSPSIQKIISTFYYLKDRIPTIFPVRYDISILPWDPRFFRRKQFPKTDCER